MSFVFPADAPRNSYLGVIEFGVGIVPGQRREIALSLTEQSRVA